MFTKGTIITITIDIIVHIAYVVIGPFNARPQTNNGYQ